ncbi:peptidoglycan-binding protein [Streptomyces sp. NPDC059989]|uniref:peptidoglycan-binding protein n=1 Tax=Streptomyces sp. NPDC059989 TaxID=3347026 RepID=UPI0036B2CFAB
MTLPDPGEPDDPAPAPTPPLPRVVAPEQGGTPAYGIPVAPAQQPWPELDATVRIPAVPTAPVDATVPGGSTVPGGAAYGAMPFDGSGGGGPEERAGGRASRRLLPLLLGAAAVLGLGGTAAALWVLPSSSGSDTALLDAKASAPVPTMAPAESSPAPTATPTGSPSPSASRSPSPSASKSASPSPSASRSASASPSPSPSASRSASPSPKPPAQGPTLRYGDSGPEVEKLQQLLAARGLYTGKINGKFDWRVENAVSTFQYENDIDDEWGVYGPATRRALEG